VLGVPCTTTMRGPGGHRRPAYPGRGRRPKAPWQSMRCVAAIARLGRVGHGWTVRDGEKGPVEIEMIIRRVQTRLET